MNRLTTFRNLALLAMVLTALATPTSGARAQQSSPSCEDQEFESEGRTITCLVCRYEHTPCVTWSCPGEVGITCPGPQ